MTDGLGVATGVVVKVRDGDSIHCGGERKRAELAAEVAKRAK